MLLGQLHMSEAPHLRESGDGSYKQNLYKPNMFICLNTKKQNKTANHCAYKRKDYSVFVMQAQPNVL